MKIHYDFNTSNKSFLKMHKYLEENKIKNNKFMLSIYNKKLIGVNPYDPNLAFSQKLDIISECKNNIWYFFREIIRIPVIGSTNSFYRFELDRANMAQIYLTTLGINTWITKPRYRHKTIDSLNLLNYIRIFDSFLNTKIRTRIVSRNISESRLLKSKLRKLTDILPDYIIEIAPNNLKHINSETPTGTIKSEEEAKKYNKYVFR